MTTTDIDALELDLSEPDDALIACLKKLPGDIVVLGAGGKMGPTLARMARRAVERLGDGRKVIAVSRYGDGKERARLESHGIATIALDLLDPDAANRLPDAPNVIYMAGMKFGASGDPSATWAMNAWLPGTVCRRYQGSRIAAFSTGNVYGLVPAMSGGANEDADLRPVGEYAMSCLGRERIFQHFCRTQNTPVAILRLNYANEPRYGVIADLARKIQHGDAIDVTMGCFNAIWQADANRMALRSLERASVPATVINLAGPEVLGVRNVAHEIGRLLGKEPKFTGAEAGDALLTDARRCHRWFGYPRVAAAEMIERIAVWIAAGGADLGKPTKFQVRDGKF